MTKEYKNLDSRGHVALEEYRRLEENRRHQENMMLNEERQMETIALKSNNSKRIKDQRRLSALDDQMRLEN